MLKGDIDLVVKGHVERAPCRVCGHDLPSVVLPASKLPTALGLICPKCSDSVTYMVKEKEG